MSDFDLDTLMDKNDQLQSDISRLEGMIYELIEAIKTQNKVIEALKNDPKTSEVPDPSLPTDWNPVPVPEPEPEEPNPVLPTPTEVVEWMWSAPGTGVDFAGGKISRLDMAIDSGKTILEVLVLDLPTMEKPQHITRNANLYELGKMQGFYEIEAEFRKRCQDNNWQQELRYNWRMQPGNGFKSGCNAYTGLPYAAFACGATNPVKRRSDSPKRTEVLETWGVVDVPRRTGYAKVPKKYGGLA